MSSVRLPSSDAIESHAQLLREASMEPEKMLTAALNELQADVEQYRILRERMLQRLHQLEENFQSSMGRRTQLDLTLSEIECQEEQTRNLIEKYEQYIRKLKNEPEKESSFSDWTHSDYRVQMMKQKNHESDGKTGKAGSGSEKTPPSVNRELALRETVQKLTEASMAKEKLEAQKRAIRVQIDKEDSVKDYFMIRIKRLQETIQNVDQLNSSIEYDLNSADEALRTAKQLADRLLWLGMKLSQISDAVEELRRVKP